MIERKSESMSKMSITPRLCTTSMRESRKVFQGWGWGGVDGYFIIKLALVLNKEYEKTISCMY